MVPLDCEEKWSVSKHEGREPIHRVLLDVFSTSRFAKRNNLLFATKMVQPPKSEKGPSIFSMPFETTNFLEKPPSLSIVHIGVPNKRRTLKGVWFPFGHAHTDHPWL